MTKKTLLNKIVNNINELSALYPEQDNLIDKMLECVMHDICDVDDVISYRHEINTIMNELFDAIDIEAFDNRELSDKEYAVTISKIEKIAVSIDTCIDEYIDYLIDIYHIYD